MAAYAAAMAGARGGAAGVGVGRVAPTAAFGHYRGLRPPHLRAQDYWQRLDRYVRGAQYAEQERRGWVDGTGKVVTARNGLPATDDTAHGARGNAELHGVAGASKPITCESRLRGIRRSGETGASSGCS